MYFSFPMLFPMNVLNLEEKNSRTFFLNYIKSVSIHMKYFVQPDRLNCIWFISVIFSTRQKELRKLQKRAEVAEKDLRTEREQTFFLRFLEFF